MRSRKVGGLLNEKDMLGVACVAHITGMIAGVVSFAKCRYGALLKMPKRMPASYVRRSMGVNTVKVIQMNKYEFALNFALPSEQQDPDDYVDALYKAGCDDALIGTGQSGSISLEFVREAGSAAAAIKTAIASVKAAIPGAELIEVKPDLVGLSDVAEILHCSRQNIRKHMLADSGFPKPVYTGTTSLWHLWELTGFEKIDIPRAVAEISRESFRVNLDIQHRRYQRMDVEYSRNGRRRDAFR